MKTYHPKPNEVPREWKLVDLEGKTLGLAATTIARILRGKHKPQFTPSVDTGDFVIAINVEKIHLTGNKRESKRYYRHSGYPGALRSSTMDELLKSKPELVLKHAVRGMLPKTVLGRKLLKKLKIYAGPDHPHAAQQPEPVEV